MKDPRMIFRHLIRLGENLTFENDYEDPSPNDKDAKMFENHLNPVMLVSIRNIMLRTLR